jgi:hypothetical protein
MINSKIAYAILTAVAIGGLILGWKVGSSSCPPVATTDTNESVTKETSKKKTVIIRTPDKTVTTITEDKEKQVDNSRNVVVVPPVKQYNISALVAIQPNTGLTPVYGVSVSKQVLGPATVGAFALTNGVVGVSIGVNF